VIVPLHARLDTFAALIERPLIDHPAAELLLVMVIAPVLLNMVFFWVIDNIIMRRRAADPHHDPEGFNEDDRPTDDKHPLLTEESSCGCCPPLRSVQSPPGYQPAAQLPSVASRCRVG